MKTPRITPQKLIELIAAHKGSTIVGIQAETSARLLKTGNPFGEVKKLTRKAAFTGLSYKSLVGKAMAKVGSTEVFEPAPLQWGEWFIPNKVIAHKGEFYLAIQSNEGIRAHNPSHVRFIAEDGKELDKSQVAPFLPKKAPVSAKQEEAGLDEKNRIDFTPYKFSSLKRVRIAGKTYSMA